MKYVRKQQRFVIKIYYCNSYHIGIERLMKM